jgi:beta-RFAP synthase
MTAHVSVAAAARLHLGFLDLNGSLKRMFGGLGLSISSPQTRLKLSPAPYSSVEGPEAERAAAIVETAAAELAPGKSFRLALHEAIPAHAGLGSGTQLALAIAAAIRRLEGLPADTAADAALLQRGARSGLGVGLFEHGGLIVDGGRGAETRTPPMVARLPFPEDWRILLIFDPEATGLHGETERQAFKALEPFSDAQAGVLCRLVLMQALPAVAETDIRAFGDAISQIQKIIGDYFAPMQGGRRFTSARIEGALTALSDQGAAGAGQTSWGPTGFAFAENETIARRLSEFVRERGGKGLESTIVRGLNCGARIDSVYAKLA